MLLFTRVVDSRGRVPCSYKQRGPYLPGVPKELGDAAVEACNCFFHLMYEGAVNFDELKAGSPELYRKVISLVDNYGQIPPQLFAEPHVERAGAESCYLEFPIFSLFNDSCPNCCPMIGLELHPVSERAAAASDAGGAGAVGVASDCAAVTPCFRAVVGCEQSPFMRRPNSLMPWPQARDAIARPTSFLVHDSPLLFVAKTRRHVGCKLCVHCV